jgi:hypothetical protein
MSSRASELSATRGITRSGPELEVADQGNERAPGTNIPTNKTHAVRAEYGKPVRPRLAAKGIAISHRELRTVLADVLAPQYSARGTARHTPRSGLASWHTPPLCAVDGRKLAGQGLQRLDFPGLRFTAAPR